MRNKTIRRFSLIILGLLLMGLTGCDPEMDSDPILPGQTSVLEITFSPNPVYEGYSNRYRFTITVEEKNGMGATIDFIRIEYIGDGDDVYRTETIDAQSEVAETLGSTRIEAFGRLMANITVEDCYFCKRQNWIISADDDNGHHVEYSGSIEMIAR